MDMYGDYDWKMNKNHALTVSIGYNPDGSPKSPEMGVAQTLNI